MEQIDENIYPTRSLLIDIRIREIARMDNSIVDRMVGYINIRIGTLDRNADH